MKTSNGHEPPSELGAFSDQGDRKLRSAPSESVFLCLDITEQEPPRDRIPHGKHASDVVFFRCWSFSFERMDFGPRSPAEDIHRETFSP